MGRTKGTYKFTLAEVLIKDSPQANITLLKKRLLALAILKEECNLCSQEPVWNGLRLELQLDHINGNNKDNRLENLRILCPNCHTQQETYGRKRKVV